MNFTEHMMAVREVAVYPAKDTGSPDELAYVALGLVGEAAEVLEVSLKMMYDDDEMREELGDAHWYIVRMADVLDVGENDLCGIAAGILDDPNDTRLLEIPLADVEEIATRMLADAAGVADACKKIYRGRESPDFDEKAPKYYTKAKEYLACMYIYWTMIPLKLGYMMGRDILQPNIDKLLARQKKGDLTIR